MFVKLKQNPYMDIDLIWKSWRTESWNENYKVFKILGVNIIYISPSTQVLALNSFIYSLIGLFIH